jgi:translation initiation factor 1 (eIF-1/SUI1)
MEVMIQGPQATAVIEALEKRGVKKTFILLEDKRK